MVSELKGKRIAICGGCGFCGFNLALALKAVGVDVHVVDGFVVNHLATWVASNSLYRERYLGFLNGRLTQLRQADIPIHSCDLRDYHRTSQLLVEIDPQKIVHLAAVSHAGKSNKDRHEAFENSILTLKNVQDFAMGAGVEQFVFQSSSMVYGNFHGRASEEDKLEAIGYYGNYKIAAERMVQAGHQVHKLPYTIVRPSALYGAACVSRRVVQVFIEQALAGESLSVAGDGSERLDFTYIQDWVQGLLLILSKTEAINRTFNLAYGGARTLNELVEILRVHFPDLKVEFPGRDPLMPLRDTLSIEKIQTLLGYCPEYSLERGVSELVAWYKEICHD